MIEGKTKSGFEYSVEEAALDDYELLEVLCAIDAGEYQRLPEMVDLLLSKEQKEALKKHVSVNGRPSAKQMIAEVMEIFKGARAGKNS